MEVALDRPLRVALLLRSPIAPVWIVELASGLLTADAVEVRALVVPRESPAEHTSVCPASSLRGGAHREGRTPRRRPEHPVRDPFTLVDVSRVLPNLRFETSGLRHCDVSIEVAVAVDSSLARGSQPQGIRPRLGIWYSPELRSSEERGRSSGADRAGWATRSWIGRSQHLLSRRGIWIRAAGKSGGRQARVLAGHQEPSRCCLGRRFAHACRARASRPQLAGGTWSTAGGLRGAGITPSRERCVWSDGITPALTVRAVPCGPLRHKSRKEGCPQTAVASCLSVREWVAACAHGTDAPRDPSAGPLLGRSARGAQSTASITCSSRIFPTAPAEAASARCGWARPGPSTRVAWRSHAMATSHIRFCSTSTATGS